jgi:hypothetical protein
MERRTIVKRDQPINALKLQLRIQGPLYKKNPFPIFVAGLAALLV